MTSWCCRRFSKATACVKLCCAVRMAALRSASPLSANTSPVALMTCDRRQAAATQCSGASFCRPQAGAPYQRAPACAAMPMTAVHHGGARGLELLHEVLLHCVLHHCSCHCSHIPAAQQRRCNQMENSEATGAATEVTLMQACRTSNMPLRLHDMHAHAVP
jgi:hypothetical protein